VKRLIKRASFCLLLVAAAASANDEAIPQSGNAFLHQCGLPSLGHGKDTATPMFGFCFGYVNGVIDGALTATVPAFPFCAPNGVTREQEYRVVVKFMEDNPDADHLLTASLVVSAMHKAWPCGSSDPAKK
jgi:hypothetical protein